ncbi:xanthine dehydrogenase family protein molybdopterin-binding subunit [Shewanella sedimentimangrovi]|uniref:Xanthine dehydrogenase family protein molybdopterin-binding subunit n=1 Tax=Shewanella sedimentimangrovi TaxID=2814293 RepID=A0ABX7QZZ5_9GAMM|nr:molybdopterin cofactor-binding domain-containing protein [Shewanella sedimentimangrovi]QSX37096.1 xanthine dehydrogenase family protein molybdopterin-binding subunit [Shewanella sedimentimangrovi]
MSHFTAVENFSRRDVLKLFGATGGALVLGASGVSWSPMSLARGEEQRLNLFIAIGEDNQVYLTCHRSEMGQGIRTGIPQILADELEADWDKVVVIQALGDKAYGSQNTDGSRSIRKGFDKMRQMGAMARHMLEQAAAARWQVPLSEVYAKAHKVHHRPSGKSLSFGELAMAAAALPLPAEDSLKLKSADNFSQIGQPRTIVDMDAILSGGAGYGFDTRLEGMRYAVIARPPVLGSKVEKFDAGAALKIPGVLEVVAMPEPKGAPAFQPLGGLAVIATNSWSALEGRKALQIHWSHSSNQSHDSDSFLKTLVARVQQPGKVRRELGQQPDNWPTERSLSAVYTVPYLAHAMMEPPAATARVDEQGCEIWACTQTPQSTQGTVAELLGISEEQVKVHVTLLGGGFGRKSKPDFSAEAAWLAKQTGKPVKVFWSREDELQHGYLHAISAQYYRACLDEQGKVAALLARSGFPSISSTFTEGVEDPSDSELQLGFTDVPLALPALRCESVRAEAHTRIGWLRSVCNIQHAFGIGSFVDELALASGKSCPQMWRELLGQPRQETFANQGMKYGNYGEDLQRHPVDVGRYLKLIDLVEQAMAQSPAQAGEGWGFAVHRSFVSYVAVAIKVKLDGKKLTVLEAISAMDAGTVVNPDRVAAQQEGAVIFGLSLAMLGEIGFKDGQVVQSNFHDYPLLRLPQCPAIRTILVPSGAAPGGVGEPGVPPVAPALTNAIVAAGGERFRDLPLSKHLTL